MRLCTLVLRRDCAFLDKPMAAVDPSLLIGGQIGQNRRGDLGCRCKCRDFFSGQARCSQLKLLGSWSFRRQWLPKSLSDRFQWKSCLDSFALCIVDQLAPTYRCGRFINRARPNVMPSTE